MFRIMLSLFLSLLVLVSCQSAPATPEQVVETLVVAEKVTATPLETIQVVTPTPEPVGPRTLVVCLDDIGVEGPTGKLEEAIFDGPIDYNSFAYLPVIFEKLPSLADGNATLTKVTVSEGDTVFDADGEVVTLDPATDPPIMLLPDGGGEPVPYQGGEIEMDLLSASVKLLPDLKWSDGEPLTAADLVYSFGLRSYEDIASFKAIDDVTTQLTWEPGTNEGALDFINILIPNPRPEHIWSKYSEDELEEAENSYLLTIGWGPYILEERVEGESITLHKNPHYFRADEGLPKFDKVIYRFTGDNANANIAALLAGECDLVSAPLDDQVELLLELHQAGKLKATFISGEIWEHLDFGIQHVGYDDGYQIGVDRPDFFSDVRTRQAFAHCIDRQALVDTIFYGQSLVPDSYVHPYHPLYNPDVEHYDFDVIAGSALLEEVGWVDDDGNPDTPRVAQGVANVPDGTPLEVDYETTSALIRQQTTAIIKDSLAQCGIKANIQLYDTSEFFADSPEGELFGRRFDLGQFAWAGEAIPSCHLYMTYNTTGPEGATWISIQDGLERTSHGWGYVNNTGFTNDEYDRSCSTAQRAIPGQPEYEAAHLETQRIFSEQLPVVPLYFRIRVAAMRPDMCGVIMDPSNYNGVFWNIEEFDYGEGCEE